MIEQHQQLNGCTNIIDWKDIYIISIMKADSMISNTSIKCDVLKLLDEHADEIRQKFCVDSLELFGSVARGEDTPQSDIDILYVFKENNETLQNLLNLGDYLEALFGRKVDLVPKKWISPHFRPIIEREAIAI